MIYTLYIFLTIFYNDNAIIYLFINNFIDVFFY